MKQLKKVKRSCDECGSQNLSKAHLATYPLKMGEKQLNIGRVFVRECLDCHTLLPTEAGKEKIGRGLMAFSQLFFDP